MILAWMLYTSAATLLLGLAACSLEHAAWQRRWPARGVWALALAGSVALPMLACVAPHPGAPAGPGPARLVGDTWVESLSTGTAPLRSPALDSVLVALWAAASAALLLRLLLARRALRRRARGWVPREVDGRTVWVAPETGPAVVGVRTCRIVLPTWVLEAGAAERALVLMHEEEHVRAGDPRLLAGGLLLAALVPWNLALWWIGRRLRQAVEVDCDLRVLARGAEPRAYGRLLLDVADRGVAHPITVVALSPSHLERRIRLMRTPRSPRWTRAAVPVLLALALVGGACSMGRPAPAAATLWISATGTYHVGGPGTAAVAEERLAPALRAALARTGDPATLRVRAYRGSGGYEYIMARRAACVAGVRRIDFAGDLPAGATDPAAAPPAMRGDEAIAPPCAAGPSPRDTAVAR